MNVLGLDAGTHTVRGVHLVRRLTQCKPVRAFEVPLEGRPVAEVVAQVLSTEGRGVDVLVLSLPRQDVLVRQLQLPFRSAAQLALAVPGKAEGELPMPLEKVNLDWTLVSQDEEHGSSVLVFALPRSVIEERLALAGVPAASSDAQAGAAAPAAPGAADAMEVLAHIDSIGGVNAYLAHRPRDPAPVAPVTAQGGDASAGMPGGGAAGGPGAGPAGAAAIVDIGASKTCVEIVRGGRLVFSRHIPVAGNAFTQAIAAAAAVDSQRAEAIKRQLGVEGEAGAALPASALHAVMKSLADRYARLRHELSVTLMAARDRYPDLVIDSVQLTGGGARSVGLIKVLQALNIPVAPLLLPPLDGVPGVEPSLPPAAAYGLALLGANRAPLVLDLVKRGRNWLKIYRGHIAAAAGVLAFMLLLQFALARHSLSLLRSREQDLDATSTTMLKDLGTRLGEKIGAAQVDDRRRVLARQLEALRDDVRSPITLMERLSVAKPAPADLVINAVVADRERMVLDGSCDGYKTVQDFETGLKDQFKEGDVREEQIGNRLAPDGRQMLMFRLIVTYRAPQSGAGK